MNKILKLFFFLVFLIFNLSQNSLANEKIKIGLLIPISGENKNLGQLIIKAVRMAINDIDNKRIEILIKDTMSDPNIALRSALELKKEEVKIVIGPIFHKSLDYLEEVDDVIFLALTNKTNRLPENVISSGVNSTSQLSTIKKFIDKNEIKKTIFLTPKKGFEDEIKKGISGSKLKISKLYKYDSEPTKLTSQIEKITNYKIRKQNLEDEIYRLENSDDPNKDYKIKQLKKRYTLGGVNFDSVIIADFDESLKSVTTSLLYTDVSPKKKYFITLNQWFDPSLINENDVQPIYYPSINQKNFEKYKEKFFLKFNDYPNHLSLLSYDLVGLIYYLSFKNDFLNSNINKLFKEKSSFKGKIGIFEIKNNKINHQLNFYKIDDKKIIKIF